MKSIIEKFMIYLLLLMFSINAFAQIQLEGDPEEFFNLFALSPDGKTLAGSTFKGAIYLWDTVTGAEKDVFISEFTIGAGAVLTFSPDGTLLASGSERSRVTLWEVATGKAKFVLEHDDGKRRAISSISFSPDGTTLASCADGSWGFRSGFINLWDVETGKKKSEIEIPELPMCSAFSPDGTTLAIGTTGFIEEVVYLYLWDIRENVEIAKLEIATLKTPRGIIYVKFSPDGTALAAGIEHRDRDSSLITLWDVVTRRETGRLHGYRGGPWSDTFAFSPDGTILAVPSGLADAEDGLYLWDILNEKEKKISEPNMFAGVSPNGIFYAVESRKVVIDGHWVSNTYFLWAISPEDVFMEVAAHGKLTRTWGQIKQEQ